MIVAQAGGGGGGGAFGLGAQEMLFIGIFGAFLVCYFIVEILFLLTLQKCLKRIHPRNRAMQPAMVWLNLIPCFQLVWGFITVNRISDSLANEFYDRNEDMRGEDFGRGIGIACMICLILSNIPYLGTCIFIAVLILFIMYWSKIASYSKDLEQLGVDDYDDFDDVKS